MAFYLERESFVLERLKMKKIMVSFLIILLVFLIVQAICFFKISALEKRISTLSVLETRISKLSALEERISMLEEKTTLRIVPVE